MATMKMSNTTAPIHASSELGLEGTASGSRRTGMVSGKLMVFLERPR
ncbi:hypothetical protein [Acidovorax sp. 1608163]|nr:hypothetical protein [Acidovorax sp. 1608163]